MPQLILTVTDEIEERFNTLRKQAKLRTNVEVLQRAMAIYEYLLNNQLTDKNLLIETPDGKVQKVRL